MRETRVRVRREAPTALAWSVALAVTMLAVYAVTWTAARPVTAEYASASPRVTREVTFEGIERWCVTLGTWKDAGQARVEAAGCAARGAAGFVHESDGAWQVLGAMYDTEAQARRVARKLKDEDGLDADALPMTANEVKLRITAPEAQIELIEAADALLCDQIAQLNTLAAQLDREQIQPEAVKTLCALAATEASATAEKLNVFPGAADNALCSALTGRLKALSAQLTAIAQTQQTAPAALSGMLRLSAIDAFMGLAGVRENIE